MAFEIPMDLIKQVQISLRNEAKLASYDPDDPSLPNLPRVEDSIAVLDPSPPHLRCKNCRGRLLRGVQSFICVFCGDQHNRQTPPEPIRFMSSFGSRWFLHSLHLDGSAMYQVVCNFFLTECGFRNRWDVFMIHSRAQQWYYSDELQPKRIICQCTKECGMEIQDEVVGPMNEENESNRGQSIPQEEIPLSKLLDLEINWTAVSEKFNTSVLDKTTVSNKSSLNKPSKEGASNAIQGDKSFSLFENVKSSEITERSTEDESGDSFSGWEADFKSADSKTIHEEVKTDDPFVASSVDLSAHMNSVFGSARDDKVSSASNTNDWFQDGLWRNSTSRVTGQAEQFETSANYKDSGTVESATGVDWIPDDQWQTCSNKAPNRETADEDNSAFDASWNDLASLTTARDLLSTNKALKEKTIDKEEDFSDSWNDFTSTSTGQDPPNVSSRQGVTHIESVSEAPDFKPIDEDNNLFDVWNDFASSAGGKDPSSDSSKLIINHVTSSKEMPDNKTTDGNDDSFDVWNEFSCSTVAQDPSIGSLKQTINYASSSNEAPDNKNTDQDSESFDAWNDFTSSTRDPLNVSEEQTVSQLSNSNKVPDNESINQDGDAVVDWNDFTSYTGAQDPFNNSWKKTVNPMMPFFEQNLEPDLLSTTNNLQDIDFGIFVQPDSGEPTIQNGSAGVNHTQAEASVSNRMSVARDGMNAEVIQTRDDASNPTTDSKIDDVEILMSQMHDLSFMLQSNLTIPSKTDGFSYLSKE